MSTIVPECTIESVVSAIQACLHYDAAIRVPAETALKEWQLSTPGYLSHLVSILQQPNHYNEQQHQQIHLLAAILIKNAIPTFWNAVPGSEKNNKKHRIANTPNNAIYSSEKEQELIQQQEQQNKEEKAHLRRVIPNLLFSEQLDERIALHLRLALAGMSCFDFPLEWPTLLQDLLQVATSTTSTTNTNNANVRIRAIKTLRDVLQSAKCRKIIIKAQPGQQRTFLDIGQVMKEASLSQTQAQERAVTIVRTLTAGALQHASVFLNTAQKFDGIMCVGYLKSVVELFRFVTRKPQQTESFKLDAQNFLTHIVQLLKQIQSYNEIPFPTIVNNPSAQQSLVSPEEWTQTVDKIYRHSLGCCVAAMETLPITFAPHVRPCLECVLQGGILGSDSNTIQTVVPLKRINVQTLFIKAALSQREYFDSDTANNQQNALQNVFASIARAMSGAATNSVAVASSSSSNAVSGGCDAMSDAVSSAISNAVGGSVASGPIVTTVSTSGAITGGGGGGGGDAMSDSISSVVSSAVNSAGATSGGIVSSAPIIAGGGLLGGACGPPIMLFHPQVQSINMNNPRNGSQLEEDDPDLESAKQAVASMTRPMASPANGVVNGNGIICVETIVQALVTKFLCLSEEEIKEWDEDPEGRFEKDEAERTPGVDIPNPRRCGGMLLVSLMDRSPIHVGQALLNLATQCQQLPITDVVGLVHREACYRGLHLCKRGILAHSGKKELNHFTFETWWNGELKSLLQTSLTVVDHTTIAMRMLQARAIQVVHAYSTSITKEEDYATAFIATSHLLSAPDLVTALCAARCVYHLALLHFHEKEVTAKLRMVRENSILALGHAFALANRVTTEECLRTVLLLVSGLVEANGTSLVNEKNNVLHAIAEQLPPLWERSGDSVPIHSCLLSVLNHLIAKLGAIAVENEHIQKILFPLLDYCTDIAGNMLRADTLLEDGLKLWLVTLVTSRMIAMESKIASMLPRLEVVLRSGLEAHYSIKVLQLYTVLLGANILQPYVGILQPLLLDCVSCVDTIDNNNSNKNEDKTGEDEQMENDDEDNSKRTENNNNGIRKTTASKAGTIKDGITALNFIGHMSQLYPELGYEIGYDALRTVLAELMKVVQSKNTDENRRLLQRHHYSYPYSLIEAAYTALGRLLWFRPTLLEEIFVNDPMQDEKIQLLVASWLNVVSHPPLSHIMMASPVQLYIDQKGAALALCAAVCHNNNNTGGPNNNHSKTKRIVGPIIYQYTQALLDKEKQIKLDINDLIEEACGGTTRQVIGDGPLGDSSTRIKEILKSDPLLITNIRDAFEKVQHYVVVEQQHPKPA